jgi:anti-sigma regulatory factor (Ser/Thr protein kinase)
VIRDVPRRAADIQERGLPVTSVVATITGPSEGVTRVRELLDGLAQAHRLHPDVVADMQVALDEILSNILHHGFAGGARHRIEVRLSVDPRALVAEVEDDCPPFDPLAAPSPNLGTSLRDRRVGGLGVHFVRNLMNEVKYSRSGGRNRLVLKRSLSGSGEGELNGVA